MVELPKQALMKYWDNGDIPWVTPADLTGYTDLYISGGRRNITDNGLKSSSAKLLSENSVIFSCRAPIGHIAIAENELAINQGFKGITPKENLDSEFVYYFLKNNVEEIQTRASGTTFKEISTSEFSRTKISLPDKETQHRIVTAIESTFAVLDEIERNLI